MTVLAALAPVAAIAAAFDWAAVQARLTALAASVDELYEQAPFGSHTLAADGTFMQINAMQRAWLGLPQDDLLGKKKPADFLTPASQATYRKHLATYGAHGFADLELDMLGQDGSARPISLTFRSHQDAQGNHRPSRSVLFDLTARNHKAEQQRVAALAFDSLAGMCVTDNLGHVMQVNRAFTTLTGYSAEEAQGRPMSMLSSGRHNQAFYSAMWASIQDHGAWQGEIINRRKDGQIIAEWLSISAITNTDGKVTNYTATFYDITANRAAHDQISHLAYFDPLTQLPNRRLLLDRIAQVVASAARSGTGGAVLFIDLDNFKAVNDTMGHEAGDQLLLQAAKRISAAVRETDTVARLGGDEFVVVLGALALPTADYSRQVAQVGHKVLAVLAEPFVVETKEFQCTASMGVSMLESSSTPSVLLQHADLAMYQAKKRGGNTVCFFDVVMLNSVTERVNLAQDLRRALGLQQFQLYFQPQVNQHDQVVGAEALLRWFPAGRNAVPPDTFIPLAEESGLILPIGQWVLETACQQLKAWEAQPRTQTLQLAINVCARQFAQPDFTDHVTRTIAQYAIDPTRLKLEITESMVLDVEDVITKMNALRTVGVRFSMDDFGTGYSSLSSLTKLPLDQLKIDQSFVHNMHTKPTDAVIVRTIIGMAQSLGLEVIAEGVETEEQRAWLIQNGCLLLQGYLCGKPMDIRAFEALLENHAIRPAPAQPARRSR